MERRRKNRRMPDDGSTGNERRECRWTLWKNRSMQPPNTVSAKHSSSRAEDLFRPWCCWHRVIKAITKIWTGNISAGLTVLSICRITTDDGSISWKRMICLKFTISWSVQRSEIYAMSLSSMLYETQIVQKHFIRDMEWMPEKQFETGVKLLLCGNPLYRTL